MSIKKERNIEREKTAIDNLTYGSNKFKKQEKMLIAGLTKKQKTLPKKLQSAIMKSKKKKILKTIKQI